MSTEPVFPMSIGMEQDAIGIGVERKGKLDVQRMLRLIEPHDPCDDPMCLVHNPFVFQGVRRSEWLANLKDGEPCYHPGCLSHVTHPCEGCGRIAGRRVE